MEVRGYYRLNKASKEATQLMLEFDSNSDCSNSLL